MYIYLANVSGSNYIDDVFAIAHGKSPSSIESGPENSCYHRNLSVLISWSSPPLLVEARIISLAVLCQLPFNVSVSFWSLTMHGNWIRDRFTWTAMLQLLFGVLQEVTLYGSSAGSRTSTSTCEQELMADTFLGFIDYPARKKNL